MPIASAVAPSADGTVFSTSMPATTAMTPSNCQAVPLRHRALPVTLLIAVEARPAPTSWTAGSPDDALLPGRPAVTVIVHDSAVEKPPYSYFDADQEIPFDVLRNFTTLVATELASRDAKQSDTH